MVSFCFKSAEALTAGAWGRGARCAVTIAQRLGLRSIDQLNATLPQLARLGCIIRSHQPQAPSAVIENH